MMAKIEEILQAWLVANAAISAEIAGRIYWGFAPPPASPAPYLVIRRVKTATEYSMGGPCNPVDKIFRVTCWAQNYLAAANLADLVKDELNNGEMDNVQMIRVVNIADSIELTPEQQNKLYCGRYVDVQLSHEE